ncbi:N,N'-diacetylchitobiose phosphorylase [Ruminococcus albus SY3]|uniref:N,N'-diacetylchitobiose phosphorylase n=1 Tax=Ruminococcus albus SY3 TaxID=1341156 RepID=A0A011VX07_RUMAL|nr:glycosyl hydrolase family 65 protein [Ruminococcus albus]EXM38262.1 N,N'-diacetylchitobiose phosphorylase [Ruminococcus albus SY3]EXM39796.1 N,N'-diacetylchitobiose phosphorylase [Ruminococcus albus SY3]
MQYGYFDLKNKEYVITRPDTPAPWANYLGSPEYGAIVSNNGGGYSFVKSGANGRIARYRFNSNIGLPGRYVYIRDNDAKDYWSATWQPVGKSLDDYKTECRHGTAYTTITSQYSGIKSELTYYVPLNKTYEVWRVKVTNESDKARNLSTWGFIEFTNENNYEQDQVNLQYTLFITRTSFEGNKIVQHINENSGKDANGSNHRERFFGLVGADVSAYNGNLDSFIGAYRDYGNPIAVESGKCNNVLNYNSNACGALQSDFTLAAGETKELIFILGQKDPITAENIMSEYKAAGKVDAEVKELVDYWHGQLNNFQVETPSEEFNNMVDVWNAYQCFITFIWSRAASFIYCGLRNGYGYRDTVQDIQGIIHINPELAADKIRFMLSAQVSNGGGLPLVKFDHKAGHETCPDENDENSVYAKETGHPSYRADDALWLFPTIVKYIGETGNKAFLDEVIVYAEEGGGEATVYEHLKNAIRFSQERLGAHNMPAGLHADWNDCLRLGKQGESTFVAFQLYYAMSVIKGYAEERKDTDYIEYITKAQADLSKALSDCWDEDRFIRGIRDNGVIVGAKKDPEASMWLNPQSWAVISGFASKEQAEKSLDKVHEILNTPYGVKLMDPPYVDHYFDGALMHIFNPDTKENGGIFSQTQGWIILAESLMGHGNRAFEYFKESAPASMNDKAEQRVMEPYVHGQFTESTRSPYAGRSHVHWLTGTGSTVMVGCVEGICGMRPNAEGLVISPSIPAEWDGFKIEKNFRGKHLSIDIQNPNHVESGIKQITVNGEAVEGDFVCECKMTEQTNITVVMG